ncbi:MULTISPECIES: type IV pilus biogenesis protein PilP [Arsenophonus]|jgi:type IV pilus biogenesis protein PilP|uniref:type IV pilus biogenesis protein PilP n=1 Tax=Arsenophonus TaxID=637 RepID=UPI0015D69B9C|nr:MULTISPECIES: type IV pilus biogenesis protein PilP [Arsenophonus]UBX30722.1 type IV pilus biogenesis protein PilP [Arsenophonus apicola]
MPMIKYVQFFAIWGLSGALFAQTPSTLTSPQKLPMFDIEEYTVKHLEQLQAETILLEAKAARAKIQRELQDSGVNVQISKSRAIEGVKASPNTLLPKVEEIYGSGKQLTARLIFANGKTTELHHGERVLDTSFWIESITPHAVIVGDGNEKRLLGFY